MPDRFNWTFLYVSEYRFQQHLQKKQKFTLLNVCKLRRSMLGSIEIRRQNYHDSFSHTACGQMNSMYSCHYLQRKVSLIHYHSLQRYQQPCMTGCEVWLCPAHKMADGSKKYSPACQPLHPWKEGQVSLICHSCAWIWLGSLTCNWLHQSHCRMCIDCIHNTCT